MSKLPRRYHTPEQKAALLRRHLFCEHSADGPEGRLREQNGEPDGHGGRTRPSREKVSVSQICSEIDLQPSVFYGWLQQLLERAHVALASPSRAAPSRERQLEQKVAALEGRLTKKDAVIAEISEEYVKIKKEFGEP